jgi:glutaredoxin
LIAITAGCRKRAIPVDAAPIDPEAIIEAGSAQDILYVDLAGRVRRAAGVVSVPVRSRRVVGIEGPDGDGGAVWIADVSFPAPQWTAVRSTPGELERLGLAALPPGPSSRAPFPTVSSADPPPSPAGIVVYGATWCAACSDARAWLDERGVPYTWRNIETDGGAALDAASLCVSLGVVPERIPVIDLAGKLVVGFDPARLTTILGEPI